MYDLRTIGLGTPTYLKCANQIRFLPKSFRRPAFKQIFKNKEVDIAAAAPPCVPARTTRCTIVRPQTAPSCVLRRRRRCCRGDVDRAGIARHDPSQSFFPRRKSNVRTVAHAEESSPPRNVLPADARPHNTKATAGESDGGRPRLSPTPAKADARAGVRRARTYP